MQKLSMVYTKVPINYNWHLSITHRGIRCESGDLTIDFAYRKLTPFPLFFFFFRVKLSLSLFSRVQRFFPRSNVNPPRFFGEDLAGSS